MAVNKAMLRVRIKAAKYARAAGIIAVKRRRREGGHASNAQTTPGNQPNA